MKKNAKKETKLYQVKVVMSYWQEFVVQAHNREEAEDIAYGKWNDHAGFAALTDYQGEGEVHECELVADTMKDTLQTMLGALDDVAKGEDVQDNIKTIHAHLSDMCAKLQDCMKGESK